MEKPMITAGLFCKICSLQKDEEKYPDILDCGIAASKPILIID